MDNSKWKETKALIKSDLQRFNTTSKWDLSSTYKCNFLGADNKQ